MVVVVVQALPPLRLERLPKPLGEYGHQSSGSGGDPPPAKHWFNGG
jgi:hypothetical protein